MKNKLPKVYTLLLMLLIGIKTSDAQETTSLNPTFDHIDPPSPNASSLGKFSNVPVGPATGVPQISVPIYSWSSPTNKKGIQISLDYHAGGIRVDEMASDVGLGWALNAGGVISRTMRGIYDEYEGQGFIYKTLPFTEEEGNGPAGYQPSDRIFNQMYAKKRDTQNDLFSFNFNGRTGRFVLGRNNDILLLDRSKLKIEKFITKISGWDKINKFIITDEEGFKYEFSDYEITTTSMAGLPPPHTSAWYLSKITNPSGKDPILFEYEDMFLSSLQTSRNQTLAIPVVLDGVSQSRSLGGNSAVDIKGKRLKKISLPDGITVNFSYQTSNRQDVPTNSTDQSLAKITISDGSSSFGYLLHQDYSLDNRLTLNSVNQFGSSVTDTMPPYKFFYSDTYLPERFSSRQDHWGFPNSNPQESLIPEEFLLVDGGGDYSPYRQFLGGNRDTDPGSILAGSLTKITYPTGGYTIYEMEANTAVDDWLDNRFTVSKPRIYSEEGQTIDVTSSTYPSGEGSFTYKGINNASTYFEIQVAPYFNCTSCGIKFELYAPNGGLMTSVGFSFPSSTSNNQTKSFGLVGLVNGQVYTFKVYTSGMTDYYDYAYINRKETLPPGTYDEYDYGKLQLYVGGLRAKKISDYNPGSDQPVYVREYDYLLPDNQTSSGSLGYRPIYSYVTKYDYGSNGGSYIEGNGRDYVIRSSNTVNETPLVNGSPVTYKRVVEKIGKNGVFQGRTIRTFTTFADNKPYISNSFPTIPTQYAAWDYGQLLSEVILDNKNDTIKKTVNTYENFQDGYSGNADRVENFRSIAIAPIIFKWEGNPFEPEIRPDNYPIYFKMNSFTPKAGAIALSSTTVTDYINNLPKNKLMTSFAYDPNYLYVKEKKVIDSKNQVRRTTYSYPKDMIAANEDVPVYSAMENLNIISPVIKESLYYGSTKLFLTKTTYKNWSGSFYAPEYVSTFYKDKPEEMRLRYLNYDDHGAPVALKREKGPTSVYVWGYGGSRLLATIQNTDYPKVVSLLGGASAVETFRNNPNPSTSAVNTFISPVNYTNLPGTLIKKFVYNPLSGLINSTDEKGMKTDYLYDSFKRLNAVKDLNGKLIQTYDYHYKQP